MQVKDHYDNHLAHFYSWMAGDFAKSCLAFQQFLKNNNISPVHSKVAIDLGAGHGIQSVALSKAGFDVLAIDFSEQLLSELKYNAQKQSIRTIADDIRNVKKYRDLHPELILCCGDTITHLDSKTEIATLIRDSSNALAENGKLILSFRDYSTELDDEQRFIHVKSDDKRILTCILEYEDERVRVTDLLYERSEKGWEQKVSTYHKVRIGIEEVPDMIQDAGLQLISNQPINRMHTVIAQKSNAK